MKKTREDFALSAVIAVVMTVVVVLTLYPFLNILAISLNDARDATAGGISLWPRKFSLDSYRTVFGYENLYRALGVSVLRTVIAVSYTHLDVYKRQAYSKFVGSAANEYARKHLLTVTVSAEVLSHVLSTVDPLYGASLYDLNGDPVLSAAGKTENAADQPDNELVRLGEDYRIQTVLGNGWRLSFSCPVREASAGARQLLFLSAAFLAVTALLSLLLILLFTHSDVYKRQSLYDSAFTGVSIGNINGADYRQRIASSLRRQNRR